MARYREKDDADLRWNRIRRRLTRELDTQVQDWREEALNNLLGGAWREYNEALNSGKSVELEAHYREWVSSALTESVKLEIESAA